VKIITWNLERPTEKSLKKNTAIIEQLKKLDADIVILTETNKCIDLSNEYHYLHTTEPTGNYAKGEVRSTIISKYPFLEEYATYDLATSVCSSIETPLGVIIVYGTIVGIYGNREASFTPDLEKQIQDWNSLAKKGDLCIAGDLNMSFSDNIYYTKKGREMFLDAFEKLGLRNITAELPNNIDHIVISSDLIKNQTISYTTWFDRALSDHQGVMISIS